MWSTIAASIIVLNLLLVMIHKLGPKGIVLTWVPGRTIVLIASILHKPELLETLRYTWSSGILPVAFLVPMHIGTNILSFNGRVSRFKCSKWWIIIWIATLLVLTMTVLLVGNMQSSATQLLLGILAIFFNLSHLTEAPSALPANDHVKLSIVYVIITNIVILSVLGLIHIAIDQDQLVWAGILSNLPLMSFILIAGSSCQPSAKALRQTAQHIYMLSYQTWPNMAFVGSLWAAMPLGVDSAIIVAILAMIAVLIVQFVAIKKMNIM